MTGYRTKRVGSLIHAVHTAKKKATQACPTERDESLALVAWARLMVETGQEPRLRLLRCGFEGIRLSMGVRMQVKRQSVSTGWPDFWLSVPYLFDQGILFYGLYLELKRLKGGVVSPEQAEMHQLLKKQGYCVQVCRGADMSIETIRRYLGMTEA